MKSREEKDWVEMPKILKAAYLVKERAKLDNNLYFLQIYTKLTYKVDNGIFWK